MNFQLLLTISILTLPQSASFGLLTDSRKTLSASRGPSTKSQHHLTRVFQSRDWIDEVREDELLDGDDEQNGPPIKPDMKYVPRNVIRQNQNFAAIREAAGPELTNDLYIRDPRDPEVFFFCWKDCSYQRRHTYTSYRAAMEFDRNPCMQFTPHGSIS
mmetsp:Transcript_8067/g.10571  ORF Transcript_8067/g.10571 Transcript_8067/m.10571 type:complete len:158 (-) Transcript_8067:359-832(-)